MPKSPFEPRSYRDSVSYRRSQRVDQETGAPVWPLHFVDRPVTTRGAA